ncbi:MAG TPA: transposase [Candidatus Tripitaka californicus]|uniref:transposase n=1 Tax=Candidatus Tripitaka californicus TaxID=3367616 RepID=UPI004027F886
MEGFKKVFNRRSIRLKGYDYSQPGAYFVTICTKNRLQVLGKVADSETTLSEIGEVVNSVWLDLPRHYFNIEQDIFVIMPNHVHGIIFIVGAGFKPAPTNATKRHTLSEVVRGFKTFSSRHINEMRATQGIPVWQRNYYEHVIRNEDELNCIREYIINNPLQWQFDRENPMRIQDKTYEKLWGPIEEVIYGKGGLPRTA